jgi:hypothetical protein
MPTGPVHLGDAAGKVCLAVRHDAGNFALCHGMTATPFGAADTPRSLSKIKVARYLLLARCADCCGE